MIIKTKKITIGGIALFPFIFINSKLSKERQAVLIRHELIHIRQQIELLILPFYIWYIVEYVFNRFKYRSHNQAYRNIIFEREAFACESDEEYLKKRRVWAFLKF